MIIVFYVSRQKVAFMLNIYILFVRDVPMRLIDKSDSDEVEFLLFAFFFFAVRFVRVMNI